MQMVSWEALNTPIVPKPKAKPQPGRAIGATLGDTGATFKDVGVYPPKLWYLIEEYLGCKLPVVSQFIMSFCGVVVSSMVIMGITYHYFG